MPERTGKEQLQFCVANPFGPTLTRLAIEHTTAYSYARAVALGPQRLMLRPRETRELKVVSFELDVTPEAALDWSQDVAGNSVAIATFNEMSDVLRLHARMIVDILTPTWPVFPITATTYPFLYSEDDWTDLGNLAAPQFVDQSGRLAEWVETFVMQRPTDTLSLLKDVAIGVSTQVAYQSRETEGTQGPLETLDRGQGSCRDMAVIFAEALRTLGFGARLVSGYLSNPSGEQIGSTSDGSTHAWVEVFVPGAGWIAFDPTNQSVGNANLVPVAVARNMTQLAPVSGTFHGKRSDQLSMEITVLVNPM